MEALARWLHAHARPVLGFAVLGAIVLRSSDSLSRVG